MGGVRTATGSAPAPRQGADRPPEGPGARRLWAHLLVGAVCGLTWAASLRGFMTQVVVEEGSSVSWTGTFAWVLAPGLGTGVLLGWSAFLLRTGGSSRGRWLVWSPFLFAAMLLPPVLTLDLDGFLAGGIGGGTIGVPALGVLGAHAIAGRRPWARVVSGLLASSPVPIWALTATAIGGPALGLDQPRGLWVAVYFWSLLAVLALACSVPLRIPPAAPGAG